MHGQALALGPHGERSARLVEAPMAPSYGDDQFEDAIPGINLHALRLVMARDSVRALMILLLSLAAGAASIWLTKPVYSAQATIQIDPQASRIPGAENIAPDAGRTKNDRLLQTQVDLLASRSTAQNVANKLHLANDLSFLREVGLDKKPAGLTRSAKVTDALQDRLSLSSPSDAGTVAVRFDSHDPVAATRTANTFVETFISDNLKRRLVAYDYTRRFLRGQVEVTTARLERAGRDLMNNPRSAGRNAAYSRAQANRMQALQRWQRAISAPEMSNPISIIDLAQPPAVPAYPRPAMNMALAALVGALALGAGIARSRMNEEGDGPGDVERDSDVELPRVVPLRLDAGIARSQMDDTVHGPGDVERDFDAQLLGVVPVPKDGEDFALALSDPLSPGTKAHHAIFVALDRLARTADQTVLLLTSSSPNEGKSTIAFKLSANFAAAGKSVVVIDTDMRRGSLHRMLGVSNQLGLADLLATDSTHELTNVAQYCADRGFAVVPRGQSATNPTELLASRRFADLLDEAANLYEMVIMDGPPVVELADAQLLSGMADATVFVIQANRTLREHAKLAVRRLAEAGAGQIGLVISQYDSAKDVGVSDHGNSHDQAADEAEELVPEEPPLSEPAPAHREPLHRQGQQPEPALPSNWTNWLLAQQQEGKRHAR